MANAFLDVSDVLLDPDIAMTVDVTRHEQAISNRGRVTTDDTLFEGVVAVITSAGLNDLERLDDNQRMGRNLVMVTKFRLRGPALDGSTQYQPDTVEYFGDTYIVKTVDPYPQYGAGFVQAIIGSTDHIDAPVPEGA